MHDLPALAAALSAQGRVTADDAARLRAALPADGPCTALEADALWTLHEAADEAASHPAWRDLFIGTIAGHALGRDRVLTPTEACALLARIQTRPQLDRLELTLLVELCLRARIVPESFRQTVFAAIGRFLVERGRISGDDVALIRRLIYEAPTGEADKVDPPEAQFLFELNDAMAGCPNDPAWQELFVEALRRFVLEDGHSPGVVDEAEAAWLVRHLESDGQLDANEHALLSGLKHHIKHSELWGGIHSEDIQATTSAIAASLFSRPCESGRGGDFYYISVSASDLVTRIAVADVMGHGPAVTDISRWIYAAMASRINSAESHEILAELNRLAADRGYRAMTTVALATFFRSEQSLSFAYAGHPPMLLHRQTGGQWEVVDLGETAGLANLPLGVDEEVRYDQRQVPLAPGDRIFLYTDGLVEAPDAAGETLGVDRLRAVLQSHAADPLPAIKDAVLRLLQTHTGGILTHDDVTFLVVEVR